MWLFKNQRLNPFVAAVVLFVLLLVVVVIVVAITVVVLQPTTVCLLFHTVVVLQRTSVCLLFHCVTLSLSEGHCGSTFHKSIVPLCRWRSGRLLGKKSGSESKILFWSIFPSTLNIVYKYKFIYIYSINNIYSTIIFHQTFPA